MFLGIFVFNFVRKNDKKEILKNRNILNVRMCQTIVTFGVKLEN